MVQPTTLWVTPTASIGWRPFQYRSGPAPVLLRSKRSGMFGENRGWPRPFSNNRQLVRADHICLAQVSPRARLGNLSKQQESPIRAPRPGPSLDPRIEMRERKRRNVRAKDTDSATRLGER